MKQVLFQFSGNFCLDLNYLLMSTAGQTSAVKWKNGLTFLVLLLSGLCKSDEFRNELFRSRKKREVAGGQNTAYEVSKNHY